jgi:hypothetical protein
VSNEIVVPQNFGQVPAVFKESPIDPGAWTAGIGMSWPTLTLKGKEWGWRFRGESMTYTAPDPHAGGSLQPMRALEVVLVAPAKRISKVYYKDGYKDGERTPPTCWSVDGITPDPGVGEKQSNTCRGCDHNVLTVGPGGQRGKACSDNKRIAVVTVADLKNTDFGGPFMLRLPPGSFQNYTAFTSVMNSRGYPPHTYVTRMTFDSTPHPKVMFAPVRILTDEEGAIIVAHQKDPRVDEMLNDKAVGSVADADLDPVGTGEVGALPPASTNGTAWVTHTGVVTKHVQPVAVETAEQQEIAKLKAQLAAAEKAVEPEPEPVVVLTPEQLEIQALKAKLAEAGKKPRGRPRTQPVAPPATVTATGNGATPTPADDLSNNIADRVASMLKKAE